ncbi:MAG: hypothetical protein EXS49_00950 [Candidatus Pacebacteria bacterium]|nr:hypothetical protein [Candidatus Paceibacterota bacterium]
MWVKRSMSAEYSCPFSNLNLTESWPIFVILPMKRISSELSSLAKPKEKEEINIIATLKIVSVFFVVF